MKHNSIFLHDIAHWYVHASSTLGGGSQVPAVPKVPEIQVPKLPDWAVVDITTPADSRWPGKIADADFFGEKWELKRPMPNR